MSTVTLYPSTDSTIGSDWSKHGFSGSYSAALDAGNTSEFASIPDSSSGSNCGLYLVLGAIPGNVSSISAASFSFESAMSSTKSGGGNLYATVWNSALTSKLVATTDLGVNDSTTFAPGSSSATLNDATIADWSGAILELSTGGSSNSNSDEICLLGLVLTCMLATDDGTCRSDDSFVFGTSVHKGARMVGY